MIQNSYTPLAVKANEPAYWQLADVFKQINAPVGELAMDSLHMSTLALDSDAPRDVLYTNVEGELAAITAARNTLAGQMETDLTKEAIDNVPVPLAQIAKLIVAGEALIGQVATESANA